MGKKVIETIPLSYLFDDKVEEKLHRFNQCLDFCKHLHGEPLRFTLLKLVDHLNDNDRTKLHFILGDHLPRRLRDHLSHRETLFLMKSLDPFISR